MKSIDFHLDHRNFDMGKYTVEFNFSEIPTCLRHELMIFP